MSFGSKRTGKRIVIAVAAAASLLYLAQGLIYWTRLGQLDAHEIQLTPVSTECDALNCSETWEFEATNRFLLLGHVLRTHTLMEKGNDVRVAPISRVRGTSADSWAGLRVYPLNPGATYVITATKYKTIKMDYFIGIRPRTTDHEGILSIPDIGPSVASIAGLTLAFVLCVMFAAAYLGGASGKLGVSGKRGHLEIFGTAAGFAALSSLMSLGILDTLIPEGDSRNKILRISLILGLSLPYAAQLKWLAKGRRWPKLLAYMAVVVSLSLLAWPWIRGGATWAIAVAALTVVGASSFYVLGQKGVALLWSLALVDSARILGLFVPVDYPPIYFNNVASLFGLIVAIGNAGGFATIAMAGLAYRRFKRDLVLNRIQMAIEGDATTDSTARIAELRHILPEIADLAGAKRVAITVSLPLGRPITQSFDLDKQRTDVFDDGKVPGAVTIRCLVYGDEAMFESFGEFVARTQAGSNPSLHDHSIFCALPLRVNQSIVGALMLTGFDDEAIGRRKNTNPASFMFEEKETLQLIAARISQSLSTLIVSSLDETAKISKKLQSSIHGAIAASESADDFLTRFAGILNDVSGSSVMIHERIDDKGVALVHAGMRPEHWQFFAESPFNLSPTARTAYGPSVVAFRDLKSSYVKDIMELSEKMHPKTVDILSRMQTMSVVAVPLKTLQRTFVVTLLTERRAGPSDPTMVSVLEATEALFVAAVEVMSQKTSVLALGTLASRLIGDEDVRSKILDAARNQNLPTTIGSPRASFLLLFDLAGSSDLSEDTEKKARAYGEFYDAVNRKCQEVLCGAIRKTIGDAVIVTWDGTDTQIERNENLVNDLLTVVSFADQIAVNIGCKGARAILHFGPYFLGLVGTQTFGQIDVIGSGIDEVCKMEGSMKSLRLDGMPLVLAVSAAASDRLVALRPHPLLREIGAREQSIGKLSIRYGATKTGVEVRNAA